MPSPISASTSSLRYSRCHWVGASTMPFSDMYRPATSLRMCPPNSGCCRATEVLRQRRSCPPVAFDAQYACLLGGADAGAEEDDHAQRCDVGHDSGVRRCGSPPRDSDPAVVDCEGELLAVQLEAVCDRARDGRVIHRAQGEQHRRAAHLPAWDPRRRAAPAAELDEDGLNCAP